MDSRGRKAHRTNCKLCKALVTIGRTVDEKVIHLEPVPDYLLVSFAKDDPYNHLQRVPVWTPHDAVCINRDLPDTITIS